MSEVAKKQWQARQYNCQIFPINIGTLAKDAVPRSL